MCHSAKTIVSVLKTCNVVTSNAELFFLKESQPTNKTEQCSTNNVSNHSKGKTFKRTNTDLPLPGLLPYVCGGV